MDNYEKITSYFLIEASGKEIGEDLSFAFQLIRSQVGYLPFNRVGIEIGNQGTELKFTLLFPNDIIIMINAPRINDQITSDIVAYSVFKNKEIQCLDFCKMGYLQEEIKRYIYNENN